MVLCPRWCSDDSWLSSISLSNLSSPVSGSGSAELLNWWSTNPWNEKRAPIFFCFEEQNYKLRFLLTSLFVGLNQVILTISFILFHLYENNTWFNLRAKIDQQHYYDYRCKSPDYRSNPTLRHDSWICLHGEFVFFTNVCFTNTHGCYPVTSVATTLVSLPFLTLLILSH